MSDQTTTTTQNIPSWLEGAAQRATSSAEAFYKKPFERYTKPRVAGLAGDTTAAVESLRRFAANPGAAIEQYSNPYTDAVLDPAVRRIYDAQDRERINIGNSAQFARGYGDARHGIREARLQEDTQRQIGNLTAGVKSAAYDKGGQTFREMLAAMFQSGAAQQQNEQSRLDAGYEEFLRGQQDPYDRLAALVSSLGGVPYTRQTQTREPNSAPAGILGALLGAIV